MFSFNVDAHVVCLNFVVNEERQELVSSSYAEVPN